MLRYHDKFDYDINPLQYVNIPLIDSEDSYYSYTFMTNYGEKWLAPFVERLFAERDNGAYQILGMLIQNKFGNIWQKVYDVLQITYNPLTDYLVQSTEDMNSTNNTTSNSGNVITEKVTSFDTAVDDFINDNKSTNDSSSATNNTAMHNVTSKREGLIGRTPIQEYIRREINLRTTNDFKDYVIRDTIKFITLPIY